MEKVFSMAYETVKKDRLYSPWSRQTTINERIVFLQDEVEELVEALQKNDDQNIQEELGDIFWVVLTLMVTVEEERKFDSREMIFKAIKKFESRKPWILTGEKVSKEEEIIKWQENKKQEKLQMKSFLDKHNLTK